MFENPMRGRQARNFTANFPKISRSQIVFRTDIFRKLTLGAPEAIQGRTFLAIILYTKKVINAICLGEYI